MAGEWKRTSLREAGVTLIDCDHRTPPAADSGYPYVAIPQLKEGRLSLGDVRRISPEHFAEWTRKAKPQHHDVILSRRCNPGETAYVPSGLECALGQNLVLLRADGKKLFPPFLRWLVRGKDWWEQVGTFINVGAVFDSLRCADIPNFSMPLPPLAEQKAIAAVLGALDDKIELNRRMNATLEAMARALFQSWFVDFDPVRRNKDEGGRTKDEISALFPDSFQESELGLIPKGWEACPLAELIEVVKGRSYRSEELAESKTALVTLKSFLRGGGYRADGLKPFTGEYKPNQRVYPGDLVVAFTDVTQAADVIGKPALIRSDDRFNTLVASLDVGIVRVRSERVSMSYLYCLFLTAEFQAHTYSHATGTTVLHLGSTAIPSFVSVVPPVEIAEKFAERADPIFRLIDENAKQSRTLATLRDALLPKLLSGELSVAKIESHFV